MANYIISFDPDLMGQFQARHPILKKAIWIKDKKQLDGMLTSFADDPYVIIHLCKEKRDELDDMVLSLRHSVPVAKLIYVTENESSEKTATHRLTPVGGDSYVSINVTSEEFENVLRQLRPPDLRPHLNRLENQDSSAIQMSETSQLLKLQSHPKSLEIDALFAKFVGKKKVIPKWQSTVSFRRPSGMDNTITGIEEIPGSELNEEIEVPELGADMSDKDHELSLDDLGDLELTEENTATMASDEGLDLSLDEGGDFSLTTDASDEVSPDDGMDLAIEDDDELIINEEGTDAMSLDGTSLEADIEGENLGLDDLGDDLNMDDLGDDLGGEMFNMGEDESSASDDSLDLDENDETLVTTNKQESGFEGNNLESLDFGSPIADEGDLSDDAKKKLKEIDAIMEFDASQASINIGVDLDLKSDMEDEVALDSDLEKSLVSDDLDLETLSFADEEPVEEKTKIRKSVKKAAVEDHEEDDSPTRVVKLSKSPSKTVESPPKESVRNLGADLKEISGAYSGEMERLQATISNLRADREELMAKIEKMEEDKILHARQNLTIRAELDEKKIELSIIRKKLNDEISELKDRMKLYDEKKLILEEKNRVLAAELDRAEQKNKIDLKKVQMREKELEQRLELLKSDAETQIKNRDHKILELKRKIDGMEFDMESITLQEKKSVESRFELEDKLDKAIKTLRSAISVLENESERNGVLEALKKNIDM